jgi:hypothetical protein
MLTIECNSRRNGAAFISVEAAGSTSIDEPSRSKKLTLREYHAARLHIRQDDSQTLFRAGKLLQEYIVDAWAITEQHRLDYFRMPTTQDTLHGEQLRGLTDALHDGTPLSEIGRPILLPHTFIGSNRNTWQLYQDAMAIVRSAGKPDLFITITCNANWPEIREALLPNQTAQDRPDLVARVFRLKLKAILADICQNRVLGRTVAWMHVIEFQKRGLPHAHILIILEAADKPINAAHIDSLVSAELPDPILAPNLYQTITACMLHGPCGDRKPDSSCMRDGKCRWNYRKHFNSETKLIEDTYPEYRRRNNGQTFTRQGHTYDNRDVVPYNPYLCAKYDCHINVEVATSIFSVKYLYKYVYKGHDRVLVSVSADTNTSTDFSNSGHRIARLPSSGTTSHPSANPDSASVVQRYDPISYLPSDFSLTSRISLSFAFRLIPLK